MLNCELIACNVPCSHGRYLSTGSVAPLTQLMIFISVTFRVTLVELLFYSKHKNQSSAVGSVTQLLYTVDSAQDNCTVAITLACVTFGRP